MLVTRITEVFEVPVQSLPPVLRTVASMEVSAAMYRLAQCEMFGAIRDAGYNTANRAACISAINAILGTQIESRTELTYAQMRAVTRAFEVLAMWGRTGGVRI